MMVFVQFVIAFEVPYHRGVIIRILCDALGCEARFFSFVSVVILLALDFLLNGADTIL